MRRLRAAVATLAMLPLAGCVRHPATVGPATPSAPASSAVPTAGYPSGATNPAVTQATIGATICKPGWTATIRPKLPTRPGYQHDHFISLELGGAPSDPANLWYVPNARARLDDVVENRLHRQVCAHKISLAAAQARIAAEKRGPPPTPSPSRTARPSPTQRRG